MIKLDRLSWRLIELLMEDGRRSPVELAGMLEVNQQMVRRRLRLLLESGVIDFRVVAGSRYPVRQVYGLVGFRLVSGYAEQVLDRVSDLEQVSYVVRTVGEYDGFAWLSAGSVEELGDYLRERVFGIEGIERLEVFLSLRGLSGLRNAWGLEQLVKGVSG